MLLDTETRYQSVAACAGFRRARQRLVVLCGTLLLTACATKDVGPINTFAPELPKQTAGYINDDGDDGSLIVGVAFSGGGTRAAAFAYGVLLELDSIRIDEVPRQRAVSDSIRMVSGTSGGAVAAAYFALKGPDEFDDFYERFLLQNVEGSLNTSLGSPANLTRALRGGMNDRNGFSRWLDDNLFESTTFAAYDTDHAPLVWLNATDIYHGVPFLFTHETFAALCSDLDQVLIADAVAASAALPVAFAPIDVMAYGPDCGYQIPDWKARALDEPTASLRLNAYARALDSYIADDSLKRVRLLDGGITDNIGITGLSLARASAENLHSPLSEEQAVNLKRLLFIVTDAGKAPIPAWATRERSPNLVELGPSLANATIAASVRKGFDGLNLAVRNWQQDIISFRCGLSAERVRELRGSLDGWDCSDVSITIELLSFRDLEHPIQDQLNQIPTRLALPKEQVDLVVDAGRHAVRKNAGIQAAVDAFRQAPDRSGDQALTD
ncbi:MAG: patatin [Pseudomonadaceae bacterium]|nr:MAG: patatin [Pseudomonadaceae bacterium]